MTSFNKIIKNTGFLALAKILPPFASLFLVLYIARFAGAGLLGSYDIVLSFLAIFQMIATFGFKYIIEREVPKNPAITLKYFFHAILTVIPLSLLCTFVMVAIGRYLNYPVDIQNSLLAGIFVLLAAASIDICEGVYVGIGVLQYYPLITVVESIIRVVLSIIAVSLGGGVLSIIVILALTRIGSLSGHMAVIKKITPPWRLSIDFSFLKHLLTSSSTMALIILFATVYGKTDILMLSGMRSIQEVGYYSAAYRFIIILQLLLNSFSSNLYPHFARINEETNKIGQLWSRSAPYLLLGTVPVVLTIAMASREIVELLFGSGFAGSAGILSILIWVAVPYSLITIADYILLATHNQHIDLKINILSVVFNVILNLTLIPFYGARGAAAATLISTILYLLVQYRFLKKNVVTLHMLPAVLPALTAGCAMTIMFYYCKFYGTIIALGISIIFYACVAGLYLFYNKRQGKLCDEGEQ